MPPFLGNSFEAAAFAFACFDIITIAHFHFDAACFGAVIACLDVVIGLINTLGRPIFLDLSALGVVELLRAAGGSRASVPAAKKKTGAGPERSGEWRAP